jgi:arylsulfatase A-like enzyme
VTDWGGGTLDGPPEACEPCFVAEHALELLARFGRERAARGTPFLLFVSFWGPHHACFIPEPYASLYDPSTVPLWPSLHESLKDKPRSQARYLRSFYPKARGLSDETWRELIALYWGYCTFVDHEVGRLLDALHREGRAQDTVVLFSSDHGDMTGAHGGLWDKGEFMYEESYHVPLLARAPRVSSPGSVCDSLVSNMDLASTVLDLAGLAIPASHDGRSLVPLLRDPSAPWRDDLMSEFHGHRYLYSQRMLRWSSFKYVYNPSDEDELYDLSKDPHELVNVAERPEYSDVARDCRRRLLQWIIDSRDPLEHAASMQLAVR